MKPFLEELVEHIKSVHGDDLLDLWLVLPNQRANVYLRQALAKVYGKPVFAPKVLSFPQLAFELSATQKIGGIEALAKLYNHYQEVLPFEERFGRFYFWGKMLLDDFQDIDRHLVSPSAIYRLVADHQDVEAQFRDFLTDEQKEAIAHFTMILERNQSKSKEAEPFYYNQFRKFEQLYNQFTADLLSQGLAYEGLAFRKAAESTEQRPYYKIIYAGLNGLNACERKIMAADVKAGIGEIYYDFDRFYVDNEEQEAGRFFRHYAKDPYLKGNLDKPVNHLAIGGKNIEIIKVPLVAGQAKMIGNILHQTDMDMSKTAVVLPRLTMLFPLLHAFPPDLPDYNITLSYPLRQTALYSFLYSLIKLHETAKTSPNNTLFYHKYLFDILQHKVLSYELKQATLDKVRKLKERDAAFIPKREFDDLEFPLLKALLDHDAFQNNTLACLKDIIKELYVSQEQRAELEEKKIPLEAEYLKVFHEQIESLRLALANEKIETDHSESLQLVLQAFKDASLSFLGDPLSGMQITGMLESLSLTFDNVILPDMNEDSVPPNPLKASFIPYSIRKAFGLPVVDDLDAQYAWNFYRLIQRAKNVYLLSNNYNAESSKGYASRYLFQLEFEHGEKNTIKKKTVSEHFALLPKLPIKIPKSQSAIDAIQRRLTEKSLSVSAFNAWLDCKLKYYFRYVAGMNEPDEVSEEIQANVMGSIFHDTMEEFYKPIVGKSPVTEEFIRKRKEELDTLLDMVFRQHVYLSSDDELQKGKYLLAKNKIKNWLLNQLVYDQSRTPFVILMQERQVVGQMDAWPEINLMAKADRVEEKEGEIRIVDYKTGRVNPVFTSLEEMFDRSKGKNRPSQALQVYWYSWLLYMQEPKIRDSNATVTGVLYKSSVIHQAAEGFSNPYLSMGEPRKRVDVMDMKPDFVAFEELLKQELNDLFKKVAYFEQTDDEKICENCPYNVICGR